MKVTTFDVCAAQAQPISHPLRDWRA